MPNTDPDAYREYMRRYMFKRYRERRAEAVKRLGSKCIICGKTTRLEVDHIDWRKKKMSLDRMAWVTHKKFLKELKLCQLLCHAHHNEKSKNDISEIREQETRLGIRRDGQKPLRAQMDWPANDELLAMLKKYSKAEVARQLGCTRQAITYHLKTEGKKGRL